MGIFIYIYIYTHTESLCFSYNTAFDDVNNVQLSKCVCYALKLRIYIPQRNKGQLGNSQF